MITSTTKQNLLGKKLYELSVKAKPVLGFDIYKPVQQLSFNIKHLLDFDLYIDTADRRLLEEVIIPYFIAKDEFYKVLFVGCDWYTKHYKKVFKDKEYWTLEINPAKVRYGSPKHHLIDSVQNIDAHFSNNYLDLIICNGVLGWGLNDKEDIEETFSKCFQCLRNGGIFLLGWNDIPERILPLQEYQSLQKFKPYVFPELATSQYFTNTDNQHIYNFYIKQEV